MSTESWGKSCTNHKFLHQLTLCLLLVTGFWGTLEPLRAQPATAASASVTASSVVFIGNSFTYGAGSPVRFYRAQSVTDLNGGEVGGVPALFKLFATQAGRDFQVSLETAPGKGFDYHVQAKAAVLGRAWDYAVMQGYSTLDPKKPGDPTVLVGSAKDLATLLQTQNPKVDIRLVATWSRADQTYPESGHWHGQPIAQMALDVRAAYDLAARAIGPAVHSVVPVGEAWNRAITNGLADPNPYDGIAAGQLDLWTYDHYHGSAFGYYLEALMIFGDLTGLDPRSLGKSERAALELGFSPEQAAALQRVAFEELSATKGRLPLQAFKPVTSK
ncbi:MAG TPA: hypothetical protein VNT26_12180 [Candidatus Sulfotelmatobacter sp.]|nr:hypothetical protein [Candidatus Sulfotelmatobacter sp.]